jgi:tRNA(Ile)-lysidine synthase TilS/MesJ
MVLAVALARLGAGRWRVAGCHIDYGNRPESGAEAEYVEAWCRECVPLDLFESTIEN